MSDEKEFICSVTGRPCKCGEGKGCTTERAKVIKAIRSRAKRMRDAGPNDAWNVWNDVANWLEEKK